MIIGIDNGLDGGIAILAESNGDVLSSTPMPTMKRNGSREVCVIGLREYFAEKHFSTPPTIVIEEPPNHADRVSTMRSMGISFGKVLGFLELKFPNSEIIFAQPGNSKEGWQRAMLGPKIPKGQTKAYAAARAVELWPHWDWLASKRCVKPHDGMVDAALIARWWLDKKGL